MKKLNNFLCTCLLLLIGSYASAQLEIVGAPLYGFDTTSLYGYSTSLSDDGSILAVGGAFYDGDGLTTSGYVQVFELVSGNWSPLGQTIYGEVSEEYCGFKVELNSDGSLLVVASPGGSPSGPARLRFFELEAGEWQESRPAIFGEASDGFGLNFEMTPSGDQIAVARPYYDHSSSGAGRVNVYSFFEGSWAFRGVSFYGDQFNDRLGFGLALNNDGTRIALYQAKSIDFPDADSEVNVFEYDGIHWNPIGQTLYGDAYSDGFGRGMAFNNTGDILAIGDSSNDEAALDAGKVWSYRLDASNNWIDYGEPIFGTEKQYLGRYIDMDNSGTRIVASNPYPYSQQGETLIFDYNEGSWAQLGEIIAGDESFEQSGWASAISPNGRFVAVGSIFGRNDDEEAVGKATVYGLPPVLSVDEVNSAQFAIYPNPTRDLLFFSGLQPQASFEIWSLTGGLILQGRELGNQIDLSNLATGVYLVKINTDNGLVIKRVVKY